MTVEGSPDWRTSDIKDLLETIVRLETEPEAERLFRDLCTLSELEAMAQRWRVVRLLNQGLPYQEISQLTGASTTTVTRVAHWLRRGEGGYREALARPEKTAKDA
jgi:TrpR-related protein YerC/YecD